MKLAYLTLLISLIISCSGKDEVTTSSNSDTNNSGSDKVAVIDSNYFIDSTQDNNSLVELQLKGVSLQESVLSLGKKAFESLPVTDTILSQQQNEKILKMVELSKKNRQLMDSLIKIQKRLITNCSVK